ncbi:AlpA family transcriptional regulator [uncultured Azohydromonas sp.]|jgi:Predicted transcriptional regulator|uniref:helix-turn-helix transcriptional regulator n=1 Tax=uncultured Azohydromonas sp. TaxID=487342 RepID=UPI00261800AA|nr:AlpA family phage regulatory protein [uncultured Azohydromonas sp.]
MPSTLHTMQAAAPAPSSAAPSTAAAFANALPADLAELALLDIKAVSALVGLKSSAIFGRVRAGTFPEPVRMGARCTRWPARRVREWLQAQIEAPQQETAQQRQQARATKASSAAQAKRQAGAQAAA